VVLCSPRTRDEQKDANCLYTLNWFPNPITDSHHSPPSPSPSVRSSPATVPPKLRESIATRTPTMIPPPTLPSSLCPPRRAISSQRSPAKSPARSHLQRRLARVHQPLHLRRLGIRVPSRQGLQLWLWLLVRGAVGQSPQLLVGRHVGGPNRRKVGWDRGRCRVSVVGSRCNGAGFGRRGRT
jgi:hypothetical protein